jgi:hypothetical protein
MTENPNWSLGNRAIAQAIDMAGPGMDVQAIFMRLAAADPRILGECLVYYFEGQWDFVSGEKEAAEEAAKQAELQL